MRIGYLHIGSPQHGVCRYGRLLATEAHRRPDITVIEANVNLTTDRKRNQEMLMNAARRLSPAEMIHIQYSGKNNKALWGASWTQLHSLWLFISHCSCPLVVTLHDVYDPPPSFKTALQRVYSRLQRITSPTSKETNTTVTPRQPPLSKPLTPTNALQFIRHMYGSDALALRWLLNQVQLVFVCSQEEAKRLSVLANAYKTMVVPHFVEKRSLSVSPAEARAALKLNEGRIVTLLGFIHGRKGHRLMVETLPELPQDVKVIFAGEPSPGNEEFVQELLALAKVKGVSDRLRVTGYLSEEELERWLVATDLAVGPFKFFSASGSLSTWISAGRSILAYDLPQINEYNRFEPGVIKTFQPYTPTALTKAIQQLLAVSQEDEPGVARLRKRLSMPAIFDEHLSYYRQSLATENLAPSKFSPLKYWIG